MTDARILVVDDEEIIRSICIRVLAREGYTTDEAGDHAATMARLKQQRFDLVLLDLRLGIE